MAYAWQDNGETLIGVSIFYVDLLFVSAKFKIVELQMFFVDMLKGLGKVGL
jgi:hypothetical protein